VQRQTQLGDRLTEEKDWQFFRLCAEGTYEQVIMALEDGANVNFATDDEGLTPLMNACKRPSPESDEDTLRIVQELLLRKADINAMERDFGGSAIHFAAMSRFDVCETLLFHGASVNARKRESNLTPLHVCCNRNDTEGERIAALLLARNADVEDMFNTPPLFIACQKSTLAMVELLLSKVSGRSELSSVRV
jgi:ankyrin repeat protein